MDIFKQNKFYYRAINQKTNITMSGKVLAHDKFIAEERLLELDLLPISIKKQLFITTLIQSLYFYLIITLFPLSNKRLINFSLLISLLLKSGFSIIMALKVSSLSLPKRFRPYIINIANDIEVGMEIEDSFYQYKAIFGNLFISHLSQIKGSQELYKVFADYQGAVQRISISQIIFLPLIPFFFSLIVIAIFSAFISSSFLNELVFTAKLIGLGINDSAKSFVFVSNLLYDNKVVLISSFILIYPILKIFKSINLVAKLVDRVILFIPIVSEIILEKERGVYFQSLLVSLKNGKTIQESMFLAKDTILNSVLKIQLAKMLTSLSQGQTLGVSLRNVKLFEGIYSEMMKIAAEANDFSNISARLKSICESNLNLKLKITNMILKYSMIIINLLLGGWAISSTLFIYVTVTSFLLAPA